jgi:hypothetical protein
MDAIYEYYGKNGASSSVGDVACYVITKALDFCFQHGSGIHTPMENSDPLKTGFFFLKVTCEGG